MIRVTDLRKQFGDVHALKGVSFEVPQGSVFGLIGPNGAGKTTLMSILLGYLKPTSGRVEVLGTTPDQLHTLQGKVAALPQDSDLPGAVSVYETLLFFGRLCGIDNPDSEIDRVLKLVDLSDWKRKKIRTLSHGMKKRVGIAQALMGKPDLIVLDEPTAGLDPKHAHELVLLFREMAKTSTVLISSHNLAELEELCDRAVIIVKGEVVRAGKMDEIRQADETVRIVCSKKPDDLLGGVFDDATHTLTLSAKGNIDDVISKAVSSLSTQGVSIKSIDRGQSLLKTYLDVS